MNVIIGSDHAGVELKAKIIGLLSDNYKIYDVGTNTIVSCDYPIIAKKLSTKLQKEVDARGILICTTGVGMSIAANKFNNVRAAVILDEFTMQKAREHNDVNVLCLPNNLDLKKIHKIISIFLDTKFSTDERHIRRVNQIKSFEKI